MTFNDRILVLGANGMLGSAIVRALKAKGYLDIVAPDREDYDLTCQEEVYNLFAEFTVDYVFLAAAKVGGIVANASDPLGFFMDNLDIQMNVMRNAEAVGVTKVLVLGSSCIYPRDCAQPMREVDLFSGRLEQTNKGYALAKLCGVYACEAFAQNANEECDTLFTPVLPCNLYGPGDNFNLMTSHVIPGMMRRMHIAKKAGHDHVKLWGSGNPFREFMHVDDCADGCVYLMGTYNDSDPINLGTGVEGPLWELAHIIQDVVGFTGKIWWDQSKPDGTPRKRLDTSKLEDTGWQPSIGLKSGLVSTYQWALDNNWGEKD